MRLSADIKWIDCSSAARMRKHLAGFVCSEKSNLKRIFEESTPPASNRVEASVKCGRVAKRSSFIFLRKSGNKSQIIGACSTNRLVDLIDDFDFLEEQMNKSNLTFTLNDPKIYLDGNRLIEKADRGFFSMKSVLADFFGIISFISGATAYIFFEELDQITVIAFMLGLIFFIGSFIIGCGNRPKYVLIKQE